jgi:hypothetical protein
VAKSNIVAQEKGDFFELVGGIFKLISPSWEALKLNIGTFIGLLLVPIGLYMLASFIVIGAAFNGNETADTSVTGLFLALILVILLLFVAITPSLIHTQLKGARGEKVSFNDALSYGLKKLFPFIGLTILTALAVLIGLILFVIPGLAVAFFLSLASYILIDKNIGVIDAMKESFELVKAHWKIVVGVIIVNFAISLPQFIPGIGWIISAALGVAYFCLGAIVYVAITQKAAPKKAKVVKTKKTSKKS